MSEWKEYRLEDIAEILDYKRRPLSSMERSKRKGEYPYYGASGIIDHIDEYIFEGEHVLISEDGENLRTRQTPIAFLADGKYWVNNHAHIVKSDYIHNRLICYYLAQLDLNPYITGAVQPKLSQDAIKKIPIYLPVSLNERDQIVSVLSSLDDKIDLLHRENVTLEALAEILFRHYFIENPNPDWKEGKLTDLIKIVGGGTPKTSEPSYWGGNIGWLSGGDIAAGHKCYVYHVEKYITQKGVNNSAVNIIPEDSMVISARGTVGKYCLLGKPMAFSQSNYGILPKINECYYFSYLLVSRYVEEMKNAAYGSVFDTITVKTFEGINATIPNDKEIVVFNTMVKPIFEKIKSNQKQILALTSQRDTLLPRLMSGEVKVNK